MKYAHVLSYVYGSQWAILPDKLAAILDILAYRAAGGSLTAEEIQARVGQPQAPMTRSVGTVAVLPLYGVIANRMSLMTESSGGTSAQRFTSDFRQAIADPQIDAVVIDVDSPGGTVRGVDELSSEI